MKKIIFLIYLILFTSKILNSLDTNSLKYMPMHVGDYWVYNGHASSFSGGSNWIDVLSIQFCRYVNNHIYYYFTTTNNNGYPFKGYYRVDSLTGSLYKYDSTGSCNYYHNEILSDSLAAINGDSIKNCNTSIYKCTSVTNLLIFGDSTIKKSFYYYFSYIPYTHTGSKNFIRMYGFSYYSSSSTGGGSAGSYSLTLKGCKINGIVYGDTSTVGINKIGNIIPDNFSLSQNYPNPFNPSTSIKYQIADSKFVRLVVYDILGKEVATLVNEKLQPGEYEVQFPNVQLANVQLPSGVYFYSLFADGERMDTKKMLMIK
ncbi:MAG: T9SS type A sorting domain-containing protein [Ignavibacteria bacterium]|jgi:hypothetical protein